ncbi:hypothetical protein DICPUDRAFT_152957 [Dictyostelium purpureum]|uniref:Carbohydrate binding domain-containing protein n=1 Tax=Dictyostelium purpureum TaxID=5786 RepID=F0ZMP9_DICPU|nr:uncharacterized protein DICPUDRAFT_152957 [Dictyostelium purpureum]EGC34781.1 hypothetical protein DICPUDRAFT_152957 [Dictyostelium purpureum]|eukprot:XP_003288696.1 hypothetical protein DICPUDRAFT_152957 [Dictyostelium purpureum]
MTVIKSNGEIIYGKGELINNGSLLYNKDGIYSVSNVYQNNDNNDTQMFSNEHTFRYYFGNFYISKDAFVTIGTSNMKFKLTECKNTIFTGFLWDDLYSLQLINNENNNDNNNQILNVNQKCNLTSLSSFDNILFTTKIENKWSEGDMVFTQMTTSILNNNTSPITSLSFKTNIVLRDETSFWNIIKISNDQFTLPVYAYKDFNPGQVYQFGFISKTSSINNHNTIPIFTII